MTQPTPPSVSRLQRVIAYMIAAMVIVSVIAFVVILGAAYFGGSGEFDRGVWPIVALIPLIALPLAVIGWIALLVVSMRRRAIDAAPGAQRTSGAVAPPKRTSPRTPAANGQGARNPVRNRSTSKSKSKPKSKSKSKSTDPRRSRPS